MRIKVFVSPYSSTKNYLLKMLLDYMLYIIYTNLFC